MGRARDEVAGGHADACTAHGRARKAHRQPCLELDAHRARRFLHALEGNRVGDADAALVARVLAAASEGLVDLRAGTGDQHQPHPEPVQERHVVHEGIEAVAREGLAPEDDDEGAPPVRVHVGSGGAEVLDEGAGVTCGHGPQPPSTENLRTRPSKMSTEPSRRARGTCSPG